MPADDGNGRVRNAAAALETASGAGDGRRSRSRGRDEPVAAAGADFDDLLSGLRGEIMGYVDQNLKSTAEHLTSSFTTIVRVHDVKCEKRFSLIENSLGGLGSSHDTLETNIKTLQGEMRKMQEKLHVQETAPALEAPPTSGGRPFDGPIDSTILRLETGGKDIIAKATLGTFLTNLFADANIDRDNFDIIGDDADSRFTIKFKGLPGVARRHVDQARTTLRNSDGKYKELSVAKPGSGTTRIYINPDKNPRMQRLEREAKRMGSILRDLYPNTKWHINRVDGAISKGWTHILKLEVQKGDAPTKIWWNLAALSESAIVREDVVAKFNSSAREQTKTNWSL